jgi:hypothetical protein
MVLSGLLANLRIFFLTEVSVGAGKIYADLIKNGRRIELSSIFSFISRESEPAEICFKREHEYINTGK